MLKRTALYEEHVRLGGRLIDFGGWELPVQYSGVMDEHLSCRNSAGLFDVSHMGEITFEGSDSSAFLDYLVTNRVSTLAIGQAVYTVMCRPDGGIVDDLIIYKRAKDRFFMVVNASNTDKDYSWIESNWREFIKNHPDVKIQNVSAEYSQIAVQGPKAAGIIQRMTDLDLTTIQTYRFGESRVLGKIPSIIARTGYTGEDGFELYIPWSSGPEVWRACLEFGLPLGMKPCGLGARDTLRLEMKYPLYGHELSDETHPLEAGLGWVVKLDKEFDFIGKGSLTKIKKEGFHRKLIGLRLLERGIPRQGYSIFSSSTSGAGDQIGMVTSGTQSPCLKQAIGIAYLDSQYTKNGTKVYLDIRGGRVAAEVIPTPFYKRTE